MIVVMTLLAAALTGAKESGKVRVPPLGFYTMDLTREFWASIDEAHRLKGGVIDVLPFADINRMVVLRCNMHIPGRGYLDKFIRGRLDGGARFVPGPLPDGVTRDLRAPLLTVLVETTKGDLGLLTIHAGAAILELNGRYGLLPGK